MFQATLFLNLIIIIYSLLLSRLALLEPNNTPAAFSRTLTPRAWERHKTLIRTPTLPSRPWCRSSNHQSQNICGLVTMEEVSSGLHSKLLFSYGQLRVDELLL